MNRIRSTLNVNNVMNMIDMNPNFVINEINDALNDPVFEPHGIGHGYNLQTVSYELGYWAELNAYLVGLWGRVKHDTQRTQQSRMAIRDFLYEAAQAARKNWDCASRVQSSYELIAEDTKISSHRRTM